MDIKKLIETMSISENLKNYTRHSWTSTLRQESIAEHSWRLSLMAYFISDEFPEADINKIIQMCIFHDMGEAFTGDTTKRSYRDREILLFFKQTDFF